MSTHIKVGKVGNPKEGMSYLASQFEISKAKRTPQKVVVLLSGGMDSTVTALLLRDLGYEVYGLYINYYQKTEPREFRCVVAISRKYGIPFEWIDLVGFPKICKSALLGNAPEDQTEVPGRNLIFLGLAAAYARKIGASNVAYGATSVDVNYPDCMPDFVHSMRMALEAYNVQLIVPLLFKSKKDIVELGKELGVDFDLTYACYFDPKNPCGKCESCRLRDEAMKELEE